MSLFAWLMRGWQPLRGRIGVSTRWASSWIELASPVDFQRGDRLRLTLAGNATRILIRVLPAGADPNQPVGIIAGTPFKVPQNKIVELTLTDEYRAVIQISVHGGPNPWGTFPLGRENGPVTLLRAARLRT